ncbi:hypothetical protein GCM10007242_23700 [Pigmentiphaga litoralis]|nr:hypothetical protein GCM10007242_23700 [Pigmentiphaga litoralis]
MEDDVGHERRDYSINVVRIANIAVHEREITFGLKPMEVAQGSAAVQAVENTQVYTMFERMGSEIAAKEAATAGD